VLAKKKIKKIKNLMVLANRQITAGKYPVRNTECIQPQMVEMETKAVFQL
jgi:hypothetical protein